MSGILEQILANQATIMQSQQEILSQLSGTAVAVQEVVVSGDGSGQMLPEIQTETVDIELDTDGVPWDERIHSSNKKRTKNGQGVWQKKRGVDDKLHADVTAELKAKQAAGIVGNAPIDDNITEAETPAPAAQTPNVPAAQTPNVPPAPGAAPAPAADQRKPAITAIDALCSKYQLNFDVMIDYYINHHNVQAFDAVTDYAKVIADVKTWDGLLLSIQGAVKEILAIYANDTSVISDHIESVYRGYNLNGVCCEDITTLPFDSADACEAAMLGFLDSCKAAAGIK